MDGGKIKENSGAYGEVKIQYKQCFQGVETNKILGWPSNMCPLAKSGHKSSSL